MHEPKFLSSQMTSTKITEFFKRKKIQTAGVSCGRATYVKKNGRQISLFFNSIWCDMTRTCTTLLSIWFTNVTVYSCRLFDTSLSNKIEATTLKTVTLFCYVIFFSSFMLFLFFCLLFSIRCYGASIARFSFWIYTSIHLFHTREL